MTVEAENAKQPQIAELPIPAPPLCETAPVPSPKAAPKQATRKSVNVIDFQRGRRSKPNDSPPHAKEIPELALTNSEGEEEEDNA